MRTLNVEVKAKDTQHQKNTDGSLGPVCGACGGFGYTLGIGGRDHGCTPCGQTGIAVMSNMELQQAYAKMATDLRELKKLLVKALKEDGKNV